MSSGLEADLRVALEKDQFELHYQPQVDLETGRLTGTEALIRWRRPGSGDSSDSHLVSPDDFIPVAEDTGLIIPIGHWVVKEACRQAKSWQEDGISASDDVGEYLRSGVSTAGSG